MLDESASLRESVSTWVKIHKIFYRNMWYVHGSVLTFSPYLPHFCSHTLLLRLKRPINRKGINYHFDDLFKFSVSQCCKIKSFLVDD